jgi:hypothetical protein
VDKFRFCIAGIPPAATALDGFGFTAGQSSSNLARQSRNRNDAKARRRKEKAEKDKSIFFFAP